MLDATRSFAGDRCRGPSSSPVVHPGPAEGSGLPRLRRPSDRSSLPRRVGPRRPRTPIRELQEAIAEVIGPLAAQTDVSSTVRVEIETNTGRRRASPTGRSARSQRRRRRSGSTTFSGRRVDRCQRALNPSPCCGMEGPAERPPPPPRAPFAPSERSVSLGPKREFAGSFPTHAARGRTWRGRCQFLYSYVVERPRRLFGPFVRPLPVAILRPPRCDIDNGDLERSGARGIGSSL